MTTDDTKRSRTEFLVLLALSHGAMHGYEIARFLDAKSKGFFNVPFGSLYPVLHRLELAKLISAKWEAAEGAKAKKTYSLAAKGRKALDEEVGVFRSYAKAIDRLLPEGV